LVATDLAALATAVRSTRRDLDRQAGRAQQVAKAGQQAEADIKRHLERAELCACTAALLTRIGEEAQESAREMFDDLATRALRDIFGDEFSFRLVPGETGGQVTLEPVIRSEYDGEVIETPVLEARGGGMAVVVGFVLQLVMVLLTPAARKILFLDEPFVFVSESFIDRLAEWIARVSRSRGVQIVMITHDRTFAQYADVKVRLVLGPGGVTQVYEGESELCCPTRPVLPGTCFRGMRVKRSTAFRPVPLTRLLPVRLITGSGTMKLTVSSEWSLPLTAMSRTCVQPSPK
jgi:DNA repair exonuclease SbcCD ATPase subunit